MLLIFMHTMVIGGELKRQEIYKAMKHKKFTPQIPKGDSVLDKFNKLGLYRPESEEDYENNYKKPVKELIKKLKVSQTLENNPLIVAVNTHDLEFLKELLDEQSPYFKNPDIMLGFFDALTGRMVLSPFVMMRRLEFDRGVRERLNYTPEDVWELKNILLQYRKKQLKGSPPQKPFEEDELEDFTEEEKNASEEEILNGEI